MSDGAATGAIRVVLVDDHALFRRGLELVLAEEPDITIVGQAADGDDAVRLVRDVTPDVVLMDVRMPRMSGIEAAKVIHETVPGTKIIMLTVSDDEADLFGAVRAGASGYLLKEVSIDEVAGAVRAVTRGHSLISPSMASKLLVEFNALSKRADERSRSNAPKLTDRELQVLKLVSKGMSNRDIANELFIAENTVKNHVRNMLEKLGLHSRMEAVIYAMREQLFEVE
jgi:two-component system NarL family response regulator